MFVNIVRYPAVKPGSDAAFREWFVESNEAYARFPGFIRRRLLIPREGGTYAAVVEHDSFDSFMAMHNSDTQKELREKVMPLLEGKPEPEFFEVVEGVPAASTEKSGE
ncbi:MAG TPA: antibiotic biosynthesis monooxygenase [Acidimicrobiia bacterium]